MLGLPKLVANISSVSTLGQHSTRYRFSCQMGVNKSHSHFKNWWNLSGLLLHWIVITFIKVYPVEIYIQWCKAFQQTCWCSYFKKFVPASDINFLEKLPQLVGLCIFQNSYLTHGESLNHNVLQHFYWTYIKHDFENNTYITNKTPKLGAKVWLRTFGFVPDWCRS